MFSTSHLEYFPAIGGGIVDGLCQRITYPFSMLLNSSENLTLLSISLLLFLLNIIGGLLMDLTIIISYPCISSIARGRNNSIFTTRRRGLRYWFWIFDSQFLLPF